MLSVDGTEIDAAAGTSGDGVVGAGNAASTASGVCDAVVAGSFPIAEDKLFHPATIVVSVSWRS